MDSQGFNEIKKKLRLTNQDVSDAMGLRLRTVENWDTGVWKMSLMAEKFLHVLLSVGKNNYNSRLTMEKNSDAAYKKGFVDGLKKVEFDIAEGYFSGYSDGYSAAKDEQKNTETIYIEISG